MIEISSSATTTGIPRLAEVEAAALELTGRVLVTPVLRSAVLDRLTGCRLWLKAENLQWGGSYKLRGATLAVGRIARNSSAAGVIAQSTGNHAVAVSLAAANLGVPAIVVLPTDASPTKVARARAAGSRVLLVGSTLEERAEAVDQLHAETGYAVVDAFDHADVITGQGTATLELVQEARLRGTDLDSLIIPVGGGGGIAGACLVGADRGLEVIGVEPLGCDSLAQSLTAGSRVRVAPAATLADGLRPSMVGRLPFEIARSVVKQVITVDDDEIGHALCLLMFHAGLLVEPSAAAALAGTLRAALTRPGTDIGVLLSGGNAEPETIAQVVDRYGAAAASAGLSETGLAE
jgi:threonine dehydratase